MFHDSLLTPFYDFRKTLFFIKSFVAAVIGPGKLLASLEANTKDRCGSPEFQNKIQSIMTQLCYV